MNQTRIVRPDTQSRATHIIPLVLICVTTCIIASCTSSSTSFTNPKATGTAATFARNCAICHGADGAGKVINRVAVPSLREGRAATADDAKLNHQITNGGNGMPAFDSQLSRAEIEGLVKYIREELQRN
ncbi:MAG: cytochrome c [Pyrinomonadaceae bacterium MAG19_C2-C3]|nr:cytochrome c [Pyrinomonadaceae bacterium MAG19_C2-C3]